MNIARLAMVMNRELRTILGKYDYQPTVKTIDGKPMIIIDPPILDALRNDIENFLNKYHQQQLITKEKWTISFEGGTDLKLLKVGVSVIPDGMKIPIPLNGAIVVRNIHEKDSYEDAWNRAMRGI